MSARTTRPAARERVRKVIEAGLERVIPADEAIPLKGATFRDFEDQVQELVWTVAPTLLEERAALAENAQVERPGRCPHCGSGWVQLEKEVTHPELHSPHGAVLVPQQHARCRAGGGCFSPQVREWALPAEVPLTARAAERVAREAAGESLRATAARRNRPRRC